jgi:Tol biopolymer transport system component
MGNSIQRPITRFEDFDVNLETGEVWKAGRPLKVQDQPFRVLAARGAPHPGIYVALIDGDKPLQLTDNGDDNYPTWSPDGRRIAFARLRRSEYQKSLYVIPALGGSERRVYTVSRPKWDDCNRMDWSPDGHSLIFSEAVDNGTKARLSLLPL